MRPPEIIHLLPHVPPAVCGVADYAWTLARQLRETEGLESRFLITSPETSPPAPDREFPVAALPNRSPSALLRLLAEAPGSTSVLLHYSPYGFQKRGVSLWLKQAWTAVASQSSAPRRTVMFHEVAASSSPRHSAFWLRPFQLRIARSLLANSDVAVTNCSLNHWALETAACRALPHVPILPIPSNFGEPTQPPPPEGRSPHLVLFSSNLSSQHGLPCPWAPLRDIAIQTGIEQVILVGKQVRPPADLDLPVESVGFLSPSDVSALLLKVRFGYAFVGPQLFAKSGIFAAFAAHGVLPLVPTSASTLPDDLQAGTHYARIGFPSDLASLARLHQSLLDWYHHHDLAATAACFAQRLSR